MFVKKSLKILLLIIFLNESQSVNSINDGICDGIFLTEDVRLWEPLRHCKIIDGSLTIAWIREAFAVQIKNFSFPELVEIRYYLRLHQIDNIQSVSDLFPNLSVIWGQRKHDEKFALRITGNRDLEEIGLTSLRYIGNGNIHIENNPKLCFSDTIDWKEIAPNSDSAENVIETSAENCSRCSNSTFCWNPENPQLICDESCKTKFCSNSGSCCDDQCIGGCADNDTKHCSACKHFVFGESCVEKCPENTFQFKNISCVSRDDCERENLFIQTPQDSLIPYAGFCRKDCPEGSWILQLDESGKNFTCADYSDFKVCGFIFLKNNFADLEQYEGCQIITGYVDIDIPDSICDIGDIGEAIRRIAHILSNIVEIQQYLRITAIGRDLGFFMNLKRIRGSVLIDGKYSVVINNGEDMKGIWLKNQNVLIDRGVVKSDFNFTSCADKYCDGNKITVDIEAKSYAAKIMWKLPNNIQPSNASFKYYLWEGFQYFGISLCNNSEAISIENSTGNSYNIYTLKPGTKYIFQLIMEADESILESDPQYFETPKKYIEVLSNLTRVSPSSITFKWQRPVDFNSDLIRYEVKAFYNPPHREFYITQDYCKTPRRSAKRIRILQPATRNSDLNIADYGWMNDDTRELFYKELLGEKIPDKSIGRECISAFVDKTATEFTFTNVENFAYYYISIKACYRHSDNDNETCSDPTLHLTQTESDYTADQVTDLAATPVSSNSLEISWKSPQRPNGVVLSYSISFWIVGNEKDPKNLCITYKEFLKNGGRKIIEHLTPGNYSIAILTRSLAGVGSLSEPITVELRASYTIYWISLGLASMFVIFVALVYLKKRRIKVLKANNNPYYTTFIYKPDIDIELEREKIVINKELGNGHFGRVYEGILKHDEGDKGDIKVAIKTVQSEASFEESTNFLKEATIMKNFNTFHIVKLLGIVSKSRPYYVLMELMTNGDLKTFLRKNRPLDKVANDNYTAFPLPQIPPVSQIALQIADGMAYIAEKKFVHRDLAARNCMVSDDFTVKIGDFGLTRDVYESDYYRRGTRGLMPVRWMAPESLIDGVFTTFSDVFSFGIVLWEIVTFAKQPYKGRSNAEIIDFIIGGGTETRPEKCSDKIFDIMQSCWRFKPEDRISFSKIIEKLIDEAPVKFREESFYCLSD